MERYRDIGKGREIVNRKGLKYSKTGRGRPLGPETHRDIQRHTETERYSVIETLKKTNRRSGREKRDRVETQQREIQRQEGALKWGCRETPRDKEEGEKGEGV